MDSAGSTEPLSIYPDGTRRGQLFDRVGKATLLFGVGFAFTDGLLRSSLVIGFVAVVGVVLSVTHPRKVTLQSHELVEERRNSIRRFQLATLVEIERHWVPYRPEAPFVFVWQDGRKLELSESTLDESFRRRLLLHIEARRPPVRMTEGVREALVGCKP